MIKHTLPVTTLPFVIRCSSYVPRTCLRTRSVDSNVRALGRNPSVTEDDQHRVNTRAARFPNVAKACSMLFGQSSCPGNKCPCKLERLLARQKCDRRSVRSSRLTGGPPCALKLIASRGDSSFLEKDLQQYPEKRHTHADEVSNSPSTISSQVLRSRFRRLRRWCLDTHKRMSRLSW